MHNAQKAREAKAAKQKAQKASVEQSTRKSDRLNPGGSSTAAPASPTVAAPAAQPADAPVARPARSGSGPGDLRPEPCIGCIEKFTRGASTGLCYNQAGGRSKRCFDCGSHKCRPA
jgi:hypothetical protein